MKITYSVLYILLMASLTGCAILSKRSQKQCRTAVSLMETALLIPIIGNLMVILTEDRTVALIGNYIYCIGIDLLLIALVNFTNSYCYGVGNGTHKPTVMYLAITADIVQLLLNPFFGHAFSLEQVNDDGDTYFKLVAYTGQTLHRIIDYVVILCVILIFLISSVLTPRIYRAKYTALLISMLAIAVMQAYYLSTSSIYNRPVFAYGFFGILIFYFAIYYRPLRLLDQMLSNIVSDLSDAFFVFDANGKCIWANEQGCKLTNYSGSNYEEINPVLIDMFGDPMKISGHIPKKTVGTGDSARFYSLEEKLVKDSQGKNNGSYLRIQDITDEQHEIQVRDKQIGEISQEAYRDALTGVGSKAAFNNKVKELNEQIINGETELAVVMIDMNNLKHINDEYGHKAGDLYIKGCCHLICEAFKHSPVFRIGGDEFVAILRGSDFESRQFNIHNLRSAFDDAYEAADQDPWLRYSASVGIAECSADDNSFELVFKRADKAMYEDKKVFKALHGSYR